MSLSRVVKVQGAARGDGNRSECPTANLELSPQQARVARLVAEGFRSREIADLLQISPRTVAAHRAQIVRRLGLRSTSAIGLSLAGFGRPVAPSATADPTPHREGFLTLAVEPMAANTDWEATATGILRSHMKMNGVTYQELVERLAALGVREDVRDLRNKVQSGKFTAVFLLQCVKASRGW